MRKIRDLRTVDFPDLIQTAPRTHDPQSSNLLWRMAHRIFVFGQSVKEAARRREAFNTAVEGRAWSSRLMLWIIRRKFACCCTAGSGRCLQLLFRRVWIGLGGLRLVRLRRAVRGVPTTETVGSILVFYRDQCRFWKLLDGCRQKLRIPLQGFL